MERAPGASSSRHHPAIASTADADEATIRSAFATAGMRRPPSAVTWPRQARLLADGDEAGFAELARSLKGARA